MSKFKNKKALALSVGAIMAGVSVIGVVAACAPTKAKPAKPTEKKVEQPQTGGNESSNPGSGSGSGSTTNPTGQGSGTGGSTNANPGSGNSSNAGNQGSGNGGTTDSLGGSTDSQNGSTTTTKPKETETKPTKQNGNTESTKDGEKPNLGSNPSNGSSNSGTTETPGSTEAAPKDSDKKEQDSSNPGKNSGSDQQPDESKEKEGKTDSAKKQADPMNSQSDSQAGGTGNDQSNPETDKSGEADEPDKQADQMGSEIGSQDENKKKMEEDAAKKQKEQAELNKKKEDAKSKVSSSSYLLESDKEKFNKQIEEIKNNDQATELDKILELINKTEEERKNKLTPTSSSINVLDKRNYLRFDFKTSKETYERIKNKKLGMEISVVSKDGKTHFETQKDETARFSTDNSGPFVLGTVGSNGIAMVRIETLYYYGELTQTPKGNYKLVKLWDIEDKNQTNLLNEFPKEILIEY